MTKISSSAAAGGQALLDFSDALSSAMASQLASISVTFRTNCLLSHQDASETETITTNEVLQLVNCMYCIHEALGRCVKSYLFHHPTVDDEKTKTITTIEIFRNEIYHIFSEGVPPHYVSAIVTALQSTGETYELFWKAFNLVVRLRTVQSPSQTSIPVAMLQIFADAVASYNLDCITAASSQEVANAIKKENEVHTMILNHYFTNADVISRVFANVDVKILPSAMEWIGRDATIGFSAMYNLVRGSPLLYTSFILTHPFHSSSCERRSHDSTCSSGT